MITARKDGKESADQNERLLELVTTVVESWKLILIVPLLIGILGYVYLAARPSLYRSDAVLRLSKDEVAVLKSARVFGAAVNKVSADSPEAAASASVAASTPDSPDVYSVVVTYNSAAGAAAILQEMINRLPGETMPTKYERAKLENRIKVLNEAQDSIKKSLEKINKIYDRLAKSDTTTYSFSFSVDFGLSFANLISLSTRNDKDIEAAETALQPTFVLGDVIQPPVVPTLPIARNMGAFVTLAVALSFGLLVILVLVRNALQSPTDNPHLLRIRRALVPWQKS